jgi:hypothetical protein
MKEKRCPKCGSERGGWAMVGWWCSICKELFTDKEMMDNLTESLIERYSDNPPEHNKPGRDGHTDETGKIVE